MYRRSKFIEILHEIREEMAASADYDVDLFAEMVRSDTVTVRVGDRKRLLVERGPKPAEPRIAKETVGK